MNTNSEINRLRAENVDLLREIESVGSVAGLTDELNQIQNEHAAQRATIAELTAALRSAADVADIVLAGNVLPDSATNDLGVLVDEARAALARAEGQPCTP